MNQKSLGNLFVLLFTVAGLLIFTGCGDQEDISNTIASLRAKLMPLEMLDADGRIRQITLSRAEQWHEAHELEEEHAESSPEDHSQSPHQCLGVLTGYRAIQFAAQQLYDKGETPQAGDFEISVAGSMVGVWDVMGLYLDQEIHFEGEAEPLAIESFTFTAERKSTGRTIVFRLREGLIPEKYFDLKNSGATCGDPELGRIKQNTTLNILSAALRDCFIIIENGNI